MVQENHTPLLGQILALLDTACEASLELLEQYTSGNAASAEQLLEDLSAVVSAVQTAQAPIQPQLEHAYTAELLENVDDTLADIRLAMRTGNAERAAMKMEFQLFPFLRQVKEAFYFWGSIYPDQERMDQYAREEFAAHYQNYYIRDGEPAQYRLSIVVPAYNHLETTKQCVEQLLKVTDLEKLNAELILIDHGSTDGTLEYFEALGVGKVIHFKNNVRMHVFTTLFQLCRGEYFAFISNDVLLTKDWADILLNCLGSDPQIIAAVPATPNISNLQGVDLPTFGPGEFIAWANKQNQPDPSCWNDRARLMPPLGMYRTAAVNALGFADPNFYSMEFWDDDFSLRARRSGYRQIICDDVSCYHFGSVTGKEGQVKEGTLVYGRELFLNKHGVDPWGNGFCYDYMTVQLFQRLPLPQDEQTVLGIDCGMGDTPLQIRNMLRRQGRSCRIFQLTGQKEYLPDIAPLSDGAGFMANAATDISSAFGETEFSFVCLGRGIEEYPDSMVLLQASADRLVPGGYMVFFCGNPFYALTLHAMLQFSLPGGAARYVLADPAGIRMQAEQCFSQVQVIPLKQEIGGLEGFASLHYGKGSDLPEIVRRIEVEKYYFVCRK